MELADEFTEGYAKGYKNGYEYAIKEFSERLHELSGMQIGDFQYNDIIHESRVDEVAKELKGDN